jgi:phosphopantetheine--protein transferase-like protein
VNIYSGIDIEETGRFKRLYFSKPFLLKKFFQEEEWSYAIDKPKPWETLAGIWCGKEASVKAFNSLMKLDIHSIVIKHLQDGSPFVDFSPNLTSNNPHLRVSLSISHTKTVSVAIVQILDKKKY